MRYEAAQQEIIEAEEIERQEALKKIAFLAKRYDIDRGDLYNIFSESNSREENDNSQYVFNKSAVTKKFDPFFDAW